MYNRIEFNSLDNTFNNISSDFNPNSCLQGTYLLILSATEFENHYLLITKFETLRYLDFSPQ